MSERLSEIEKKQYVIIGQVNYLRKILEQQKDDENRAKFLQTQIDNLNNEIDILDREQKKLIEKKLDQEYFEKEIQAQMDLVARKAEKKFKEISPETDKSLVEKILPQVEAEHYNNSKYICQRCDKCYLKNFFH